VVLVETLARVTVVDPTMAMPVDVAPMVRHVVAIVVLALTAASKRW
jgi:hypothetical protein